MKGDPLSLIKQQNNMIGFQDILPRSGIISTFVRNKDAPDLTVIDSTSADSAQTWKGESLNRGLHFSHFHSLHSQADFKLRKLLYTLPQNLPLTLSV